MRCPKQVLVFLYRFNNSHLEYCLFLRNKGKFWQGISGGVEDDENLLDTVKREVYEETMINVNNIICLSSISSIPVLNITDDFSFGDDVYVSTEYSFGVNVTSNDNIVISSEHLSYKWLCYDDAYNLLKYDSNKTALWELNLRLVRNDI